MDQVTIRSSNRSEARLIDDANPGNHSQRISAEAFTLPVDFKSIHPLIKKARDVLTAASKERFGKSVDRLWYLVLADGKAQAWKQKETPTTQVAGLESPVVIYIEELSRRVKYVPPRGEVRSSYSQRFEYRPTGKLRLVIDEYCGEGIKRQWSVNNDDSMGETLVSFFDGLVETALLANIEKDSEQED